MSLIVKGVIQPPSLATLVPSSNHQNGFGTVPGNRYTGAGENLAAGDACYVDSFGNVMRAIEDQTGTTAAVNDVQTMFVTGIPATSYGNVTGGNYTLGYKGQYTPVIAYNAVAATVQTAIQALSTVGAGNILVTGSAPSFVFTAASALAGQTLELIEVQSSLIDTIDPQPVVLQMAHTIYGQPIGASGAEQASSRVRGFTTIPYRRGTPVTLYDAVQIQYSDGNLTPGSDFYLSGTTPGGIDTARTLAVGVQSPLGYCVDTQVIYVFSIR